jgi:hypothetical protein
VTHAISRKRDWFEAGPLGTSNFRQQLGRSVDLGTPSKYGLKQILVFAGATQRTHDRGAGRHGLAGRAAGDSAASVLQVSCTYRGLNEAAAARPLQVRGEIAWGTDGHQCSAYFDWLNGTVLQVSASFCRITAEVVPNLSISDEVPTFDPEALVEVGATIGYSGANRPPPTFTQQLRLEPDGETLQTGVVAIPRFARSLRWLGPVLTEVQWAIGPGAGQAIAQVDPDGLQTRWKYERPGPATHLQVIGNNTATLNALVWELAL